MYKNCLALFGSLHTLHNTRPKAAVIHNLNFTKFVNRAIQRSLEAVFGLDTACNTLAMIEYVYAQILVEPTWHLLSMQTTAIPPYIHYQLQASQNHHATIPPANKNARAEMSQHQQRLLGTTHTLVYIIGHLHMMIGLW